MDYGVGVTNFKVELSSSCAWKRKANADANHEMSNHEIDRGGRSLILQVAEGSPLLRTRKQEKQKQKQMVRFKCAMIMV